MTRWTLLTLRCPGCGEVRATGWPPWCRSRPWLVCAVCGLVSAPREPGPQGTVNSA